MLKRGWLFFSACLATYASGMASKKYPVYRDFTLYDIEMADKAAQSLLKGEKVDLPADDSVVKLLVRYNKHDALIRLLDAGYEPTYAVLAQAIIYGRHASMRLLLERFPKLATGGDACGTALHLASLADNCTAVSALLLCGIDVNSINKHHDTPLHLAAKRGFEAMVRLLCLQGANPLQRNVRRNARGSTPLDCAYKSMWKVDLSGPMPQSNVPLFTRILHIMYEYVPRFGGNVIQ